MTQDTILVIEDDDAVRQTMVQVLEHAGFRVLTAKNGSEAVRLFGDHAARIAAATLDLVMPETDGRETLAMFSEFAKQLPIVVVTALPLPGNLLGRIPGSRGVGYLQKPFMPDALISELRRVIAEMRDAH